MYKETINSVCESAITKVKLAKQSIPAYLIHAAMAGAYVGLGIILIFAIGTALHKVDSPFTSLAMATTFGIALSLVIIAGADLFTGNTMVLPMAAFAKRVTWKDVGRVLLYSYIGNCIGSVLVAFCAYQAGTFSADPSFVLAVAAKKMNSPFLPLFFKAVLCNWLVVLAVWSAFRCKTESGKLVMIWWCLLAFIGSGYEHSIANMTLLTLANFLPHDASLISWQGWVDNLIPVTLGNIFSGAILMAGAYFFIEKENDKVHTHAVPVETPNKKVA